MWALEEGASTFYLSSLVLQMLTPTHFSRLRLHCQGWQELCRAACVASNSECHLSPPVLCPLFLPPLCSRLVPCLQHSAPSALLPDPNALLSALCLLSACVCKVVLVMKLPCPLPAMPSALYFLALCTQVERAHKKMRPEQRDEGVGEALVKTDDAPLVLSLAPSGGVAAMSLRPPSKPEPHT